MVITQVPDPVRLLLSWFGLCRSPDVHHKQLDIRFSAGSYVGTAVALIASRISQSFRLHDVRRYCHESGNLSAFVWTSSLEVRHCPAASCEVGALPH